MVPLRPVLNPSNPNAHFGKVVKSFLIGPNLDEHDASMYNVEESCETSITIKESPFF